MSLGLETKHPAERGTPPGFGEFLNTCGWCNKKIGDQSVYMFGNFNAFCKHECQEKMVSLLYKTHLFESGLSKVANFSEPKFKVDKYVINSNK
ncbi:putative Zf-FLZ domain-containing protein [Lupinus albus]|uniref:Putative Zf-FLZ domain-containing protein n=1 Tax=Lupinus albus TaxID=3870 RepID=A0A6A4Q3K4_LUPAL|nr:putative Zf-FLZ domain-containing protein [Lupinus albus]